MKRKYIALLAGVLFVAACYGFYYKVSTVVAGAKESLASELSSALGATVSVDSLELTSWRSVTVHKVTVLDKQSQPLAVSDKIIVDYNPWDILCGTKPLVAISRITVVAPHLSLTRRSSGVWNVEELGRPDSNNANTDFRGELVVQDGTATVTVGDANWNFAQISGAADFSRNPEAGIHLQAVRQSSTFQAEGVISTSGKAQLRLVVDQVSLTDMAALTSPGQEVRVVGGTARQVELTARREAGRWSYAGDTVLATAAVDIRQIPVRDISGRFKFNDKSLFLADTTATVYGQKLAASGYIQLDANTPLLDLRLSSVSFDPAVLPDQTLLCGAVAFQARVSGRADNPALDGEVRLAKGEVYGYGVTQGKAVLRLQDKLLKVDECQADALGGHLALDGIIDLKQMAYQLHAKGSHIDTAFLADRFAGGGVSGQGEFDLRMFGQGAVKSASIYGTVALSAGQYRGIAFDSLQTGFLYQHGDITLDFLNATVGNGTLAARGVLPGGGNAIHVEVYAHDLPVAAVTALNHGLVLSGTGDFSGVAAGTREHPELSGDVIASHGQVFYQPFTRAQGQLRITPEVVSIEDVVLVDGAASHHIDGTIALNGQTSLCLTVVSKQARAENIVKLLVPGENLTGNVDNEVVIRGPLSQLDMDGRVTLTEGSFRGQLIARGEGSYHRHNGLTVIQDFTVNSLNTQIKFSGSIGADQALDFDVTANDIELASLYLKFPYPVTGRVNFAGKLSGTSAQPVFFGQLTASQVTVNKQEFSELSSMVNIHGNQVDIPSFSFKHGSGRFDFSGAIDFQSRAVSGNIAVENGDISALLAVLNLPDKEIEGNLNGHVTLSGSADKPNIWLIGSLHNGKVRHYPLEHIDVDAELVNDILTIHQFSARAGNGVLAMTGSADLNGPLKLEIGAKDIDAGLLAAWFGAGLDLKGKLGFTAQIGGTAAKPQTAISLEITGGGVDNTVFDSLTGLLVVDKDTIHVNQLFLTKGPYRASVYGVIPLAALHADRQKPSNASQQMNLKLRLDEADLSILPLLTKQVAWASGPTKGELTVAGTLAQPLLYGSISVADGTVKLAALNKPIQKINLAIQLEGDKITVAPCDGQLGGGQYHLQGTAYIRGFALDNYNMTLALDKPYIDSRYFKGPISGKLALTQDGSRPKLSGKLLFEKDTINIPAIPDLAPSSLDMALDLELTAGHKLRFYNPYLYDILAAGGVKISGTLHDPSISGHVHAIRGTVSYLRTKFRIKHAGVEFPAHGVWDPTVNLGAVTRLAQTTVNLKISGQISTLKLTLTSDPPLSQQDIITLLTLRSNVSDQSQTGRTDNDLGRDEFKGLLSTGLQMRFVNEMEGTVRDALGLDEFTVSRDRYSVDLLDSLSRSTTGMDDNTAGYSAEFTKYLNERLMLTYSIGLNHNGQRVNLRYNINKNVGVVGALDSQHRYHIGVETGFRF